MPVLVGAGVVLVVLVGWCVLAVGLALGLGAAIELAEDGGPAE